MTKDKLIRCLVINPYSRTFSELYIEKGLEGLRYALGSDPMFSGMVECVNLAQLPERGIDLWCDEESNLSEGRPVFEIKERTFGEAKFSGVCIILDNDGNGETDSTDFLLKNLDLIIHWTDLETTGEFGEGCSREVEIEGFGKVPVFEGGKPVYRGRRLN